MMALFPIFLLVAVTLQFCTSLPEETCHCTRYPNGSVEFRVSTRGENYVYNWLHNGRVIAHDGDVRKDGMPEEVVYYTADVLILKTLLQNISYKGDGQSRVHPIPCICNSSIPDSLQTGNSSIPDSFRTDNSWLYYVGPVLALILILSGVVLYFLCKKHPKLCCRTTRLTAGQQDIVMRFLPPDLQS